MAKGVNPKRSCRVNEIKIRRDYPAFTIRLPLVQYSKLVARAEKNRRSLAAEVEIIMEGVL